MVADETRERILEAARELCGSRGFRVEGKEIATEAGVSQAAMYRRFPRRIDIVEALIAEMLESANAALLAVAETDHLSAAETIRAINRVGFDHVRRYGQLASEATAGNLPPGLEGYMHYVHALWAFMGTVIARGIQQGEFRRETNPRLAVIAWRALVSPEALQTLRADAGVSSTEEMSERISDFIIGALGGDG